MKNNKVKINEILKENHNLKGKIKSIEDSSTKECESLKKSLVESLEKIKILEKKKDGIRYLIKMILVNLISKITYNQTVIIKLTIPFPIIYMMKAAWN
jgi:hypothetical protein